MNALLSSFSLIALAEMGDKTQLVALAFAARYKVKDVIGGIFAATLLVHLFSVAIGESLGLMIPESAIRIIAGISFIGFGVWTLRGDECDDDSGKQAKYGPFMTVAIAFFLAELGDKTMLATVALASRYQSFIGVWLGSTIGMVVADGLAIIVGVTLGKKLPEKLIQYISAGIFILFGAVALIEPWLTRT